MNYQKARQRMVEKQIARRGVDSARVLEAFRTVPRHVFVPERQRQYAYSDSPLPIGDGQTISQPYIVAYMTEALDIQPQDRVLEVGTGSGYQAAILGFLADEVYTVERHPALAEAAEELLQSLGYSNIHIVQGDGTKGLPVHAPYQAVMVTAAAPEVPQPLLDQLDEQGRLIMPVGGRAGQVLQLWTRQGDRYHKESLTPVAFVPLIGDHGWNHP
jgi:protein-L-isoaspartate(D-aspartate) O-methyltransferase